MEEIKPSLFRRGAEQAFKKSMKIPAATCGAEIDAANLLDFLRNRKDYENYKFDSCLLYLIASAALEMPAVNVRWKGEGNDARIIKCDDLDLGIALVTHKDNESGTAVAKIKTEPQKGEIKSAWRMSLYELNKVVMELSEKARAGRLSVNSDLMPPPNIVFNNLGVYKNIDFGVPLLPCDATLLISAFKAKKKPIEFKGYIFIRTIMPLSVTFDHRLFDGAAIDQFLGILKEKIENPRF